MNLLLLASALLPTAILLWLFIASDEFPEPPRAILIAFGMGVLIGFVLLFTFTLLEPFTALFHADNPYLAGAAGAVFMAAIPEEGLKYVALRWGMVPHREFDEPMDGIVYGVTISLGFATLENILYVINGGWTTAAMRALTAVPCHAMLGAIMGYYVGRGTFTPEFREKLYNKALLVPIVLHSLYDIPPLVFKSAQQMEVALYTEAQWLLGILFLVALKELLRRTAIATGTFRVQQRNGERPGFGFEGVADALRRRKPAAAALHRMRRQLEQEMRDKGRTRSLSRMLLVLYLGASIFCVAITVKLFLIIQLDWFSGLVLGTMALVFCGYAVSNLNALSESLQNGK